MQFLNRQQGATLLLMSVLNKPSHQDVSTTELHIADFNRIHLEDLHVLLTGFYAR